MAAESGGRWLDGRSLSPLPSLPPIGPSSAIAFAGDGARYASATLTNAVVIRDLAQGRLLQTLRPPGPATTLPASPQRIVDLAFSPDGALLSAAVMGYYEGGQGSIWSWDTANGMDRQIVSSYGAPTRLTYRPGGLVVAVGSTVSSCARGGGGVTLWDLAITQQLRQLSNGGNAVADLAISPDGSWLAAATQTGEGGRCTGNSVVQIWDIAGGEARRTMIDTGNATAVAISPHGDRLAAGYLEGYIVLWRLTGERLATLVGGTAGVIRMAFSPDGSSLVALDRDGMVRLWLAQIPPEVALQRGPHVQSTGRRIDLIRIARAVGAPDFWTEAELS